MAPHGAAPLLANYFHFGNSCPALEFSLSIDVGEMLIDGRYVHLEQIGYLGLRQPDRLAVDLDIELKFAAWSHVDGRVRPQGEASAAAGGATHRAHI